MPDENQEDFHLCFEYYPDWLVDFRRQYSHQIKLVMVVHFAPESVTQFGTGHVPSPGFKHSNAGGWLSVV